MCVFKTLSIFKNNEQMIIEDKEYIILAYFNIHKIDYVLYTIDDGIKEIYLSQVIYQPRKIILEKIDKEYDKELKVLIAEFLVNDHNYAFLKKIGYHNLELDQLKANMIERKGYQKIHLTDSQYAIFAANEKLKRTKPEKDKTKLWIIFLLILFITAFSFILILFFL